MMINETDEDKIEREGKQQSKELLEGLLLWLAKAEIDFKVKSWEGDIAGRDIIIDDKSYLSLPCEQDDEGCDIQNKPTREIRIGIGENGFVSFESEEKEK